jgi:tRNA-modifying protein YgfZ
MPVCTSCSFAPDALAVTRHPAYHLQMDMPPNATGEAAPDRTVWQVTGRDALTFLQGLVTNDVLPLAKGPGVVWTALLTPQGKYLADFFVVAPPQGDPDTWLIDIQSDIAAATMQRLQLYRLRANVTIVPAALQVRRGLGPCPADALPDPRHPEMGWRAWGTMPGTAPAIDWSALRVAALIPQTGIELIANDTFILETGFERLHGVDFRKGCYVGQEVTARMKHKTDLRKGLARVTVTGAAPIGTEITDADGKTVGSLLTQSHGHALAYLRFDRASGPMTAAGATVTWAEGS